jgi:hypothetical protein
MSRLSNEDSSSSGSAYKEEGGSKAEKARRKGAEPLGFESSKAKDKTGYAD